MGLVKNYGSKGVSSGAIADNVVPPKLSVKKILAFIRKQLPLWSLDPDTPKNVAENLLNESLCGFLDYKSRSGLKLCQFMHEVPQRGRRKIDVAAKPVKHIFVDGYVLTKNDPVFVIEGKRLPAPDKSREREYVTGSKGETTGGIQRFKLGEHGEKFKEAAIVGYVHSNSFHSWFITINSWIDELIHSESKLKWKESEKLSGFYEDEHAAYSISNNDRDTINNKSDSILLHHFWVWNRL